MNFTKEELRMIETLAYTEAIKQANYYLDLMIKADKLEGKPNVKSQECFSMAWTIHDKMRTLSAKAGKMSEEEDTLSFEVPHCCFDKEK